MGHEYLNSTSEVAGATISRLEPADSPSPPLPLRPEISLVKIRNCREENTQNIQIEDRDSHSTNYSAWSIDFLLFA